MSKQSEAKERQEYHPSPPKQVCGNCRNYTSTIDGYYGQEKNKRCTLGGFAVKKTATCKFWKA